MQKLPPGVSTGQRVAARGDSWLVVQRDQYDDCILFTLRGAGDDNRGHVARLLTPFDRLQPAHRSRRVRRASRGTVLRAAARAVARSHGWLESWSAATAKIDVLPWQIEPAMAAVSGATRLLLTDAVGLGKTIQAGLILAELRARGFVSRALVLTPASLREQWRAELGDRFGLDAQVFDHVELMRLGSQLPPGVNPWSTADIAISSIDLVKRPEVRAALDAVPLDMLVVDEAHHLTPGTDRAAVVADLACRTPWVVLATATPHSGDEAAFTFLMSVGALGDRTPPLVFRRSAHEVGQCRSRREHFHQVRPTRPEREMLDETLTYATTLWKYRDQTARHRAFVSSVICRRAVSSSRALARTLARRRQLLIVSECDVPAHPELPWLEEEDADGIGSDHVLGTGALPDVHGEIAQLDRLISLAERVSQSSKFTAIERLLARFAEPAIIFSEYRDTVCELEQRLAHRLPVATLHGGLSARERRAAISSFVNGTVRVLLATDAAGEGLNLQARCRLVINVELPWSPVRLEQRIGRVDRFGQRRRVHAIHLYHRDSFEDRVLARLQRRIAAAQRDLGDRQVSEAEIAAAIFDGERFQERIAASTDTAPHARSAIADRSDLRRKASRIATRGRPFSESAALVCMALPKRCPLAGGAALLFEWDVHDSEGRLIAREVACVVATLERARRLRRATAGAWSRHLLEASAVRGFLDELRLRRLREISIHTCATASAVEERLAAIDRALQDVKTRPLQGSLFDRRAEQHATAARSARRLARARIAHLESSIRALRTLNSPEPPRLIAAWPIPAE